MKDLRLHQTISSGLRGNRSRYGLGTPPPAAHVSYKQEMVGQQFGWVKIISPEKRWNRTMNHCYVLTQCTGCGSTQWTNYSNLRSGKSKGCQNCSQPRKIPLWLDRRLTAAKQRCENPRDPEYRNYGARGIRFDFASVTEAGLYLIGEHGGIPPREMQIDRIDTNGNYTRGNMQFVTRSGNQGNRRITVLSEFQQKYWPYSPSVVSRKLAQGMSRSAIIREARKAVREKRKNWRVISARLDFMISRMPDRITVLPYRAGLSTTAATAAPWAR